jgi:UDP-N-acetylglucosamine/UDP-N-acetylgalactosamine diphosphorylase
MEKVGNVVTVDGKMMIIEYSDLPEEQAGRRDAKDDLVFWAGNIAVHVFSVDFLRRISNDGDPLPFHRASKKVPFVDSKGENNQPATPNAIKFEKFIFDLMPLAQNPIVAEADAREVFAPLKNASGAPRDTPESTRDAIVAKHRRMLEDIGVNVMPGVKVEVNSLFALDSDDLRKKLTDSMCISEDQYFEA